MSQEVSFKRIFTIEEAEQTMPLVRSIVEDILAAGAALKRTPVAATSEDEQQQFQELIFELQEMGCFYKDGDFELGLVDFPAIVEGELVFLCWRSDEPALRFYHRMEDGYAGRRPLPGVGVGDGGEHADASASDAGASDDGAFDDAYSPDG